MYYKHDFTILLVKRKSKTISEINTSSWPFFQFRPLDMLMQYYPNRFCMETRNHGNHQPLLIAPTRCSRLGLWAVQLASQI